MDKVTTPNYPTPFVGRIQERSEIVARLLDPACSLLTITGVGGAGKTRLAIETAREAAQSAEAALYFVSLQPVVSSDNLPFAIAQAANITLYSDQEPIGQILAALRDRKTLLLLDNFEHLVDDAPALTPLFAAAPSLTILATSREPLGLQEEWLYPLAGLRTPNSIYQESSEEYDAVRLFLHLARRVRPDFDLTTFREAVYGLCTLTAGIPLAIELAASWLRALHPNEIASEVQRNYMFLTTTARNVEPRHRSMRAVFDHSWRLLSDAERSVFAQLSVFRGGFTLSRAEIVAGASPALLAALVEKSLVQREGADRYTVHELLRQYGSEMLHESGVAAATQERHCVCFAALMREYESEMTGSNQVAAFRAIEADYDNFLLAWESALGWRDAIQLHALLGGFYLYGFLRSRYIEMLSLFVPALALLTSLAESPHRTERLLYERLLVRRWGYLHWLHLDDYSEAREGIENALRLAVADEEQFEIGFSNLMLAYPNIWTHQFEGAIASLTTARVIFETMGQEYYVCWVLHRLGYVCYNTKHLEAFATYTRQSLILARRTRNLLATVICLYNLGSYEMMSGDFARGRQSCQEALETATESSHDAQIAHSLSLIAICDLCLGNFAAARNGLERSRAIVDRIGMQTFQAYNLAPLALLAYMERESTDGLLFLDEAARYKNNNMGVMVLAWATSVLHASLSNPVETRRALATLLNNAHIADEQTVFMWAAPAAAWLLHEKLPERSARIVAWIATSESKNMAWARALPLLRDLENDLQTHWEPARWSELRESGVALSLGELSDWLVAEFLPDSSQTGESFHKTEPRHEVQLAQTLPEPLTEREVEVLELLATGATNLQIAERLIIGAGTVKTHTLNIYRKLDVANRTEAVNRARALGILRQT